MLVLIKFLVLVKLLIGGQMLLYHSMQKVFYGAHQVLQALQNLQVLVQNLPVVVLSQVARVLLKVHLLLKVHRAPARSQVVQVLNLQVQAVNQAQVLKVLQAPQNLPAVRLSLAALLQNPLPQHHLFPMFTGEIRLMFFGRIELM